jgi:hypothetical protein
MKKTFYLLFKIMFLYIIILHTFYNTKTSNIDAHIKNKKSNAFIKITRIRAFL